MEDSCDSAAFWGEGEEKNKREAVPQGDEDQLQINWLGSTAQSTHMLD